MEDLPLSEPEAAARLAAEGPNELPRPPLPNPWKLVWRQLRDPLVLVLLVAGTMSIGLLGEYPSGIAILLIVALDVAIGAVQQHNADRAVESLRGLIAPQARVERDTGTRLAPAAQLVRGDIVALNAGDRVPADIRLLETHSFAVEEAILTGESVPVDKHAHGRTEADVPLGERTGVVFSGTMVVRGRARGLVLATGPRTELGRIARQIEASPPPPIERELREVARRVSLVAALAGLLLAIVVVQRAHGRIDLIYDGILAGVALAIAAVPEGLVAVVTSALALGARRMARQGAIVREAKAVETLGSASVLCVDKTGTLTLGHLRVADVLCVAGREGRFWEAALRCNDAHEGVGDPLDVALAIEARAREVQADIGRRSAERPFDARTRMMSTVHDTPTGPMLSVKGAPEAVLPRCKPDRHAQELSARVADFTSRGLRVLLLASLPVADVDADGLDALGLAVFEDPLRPTTRAAVAAATSAGIQVVMVTGDHAGTARAVAASAGLDASRTVTGADLAALDPSQRHERLAAATVVARVDPELKVELVEAHRAEGHVVAMMGDGVNDAPALRRADIGIAVAGQDGSDVAREAADIVLAGEDLSLLVEAVREGRRIYRNLQSVVGYLLSGNASEVLVTVAGLFLFPSLVVPLLPAQLLWINLVTDGLPALALGVDRPPRDPLEAPPRPREKRLLGWRGLGGHVVRGVWIAAVVVGSTLVARAWDEDPETLRTQLFLSLILSHLALAYVIRSGRFAFERGWYRNRGLLLAMLASVALQVPLILVPGLRGAFGLRPLPMQGWAVALAAAFVVVVGTDLERWMRHLATARRPAPS